MPETVVTIKLTPRKWRVMIESLRFAKRILGAKNVGDMNEFRAEYIQALLIADPNNLIDESSMQRAILFILKDLDAE